MRNWTKSYHWEILPELLLLSYYSKNFSIPFVKRQIFVSGTLLSFSLFLSSVPLQLRESFFSADARGTGFANPLLKSGRFVVVVFLLLICLQID